MGIITEAEVSGKVPETDVFAVHYPAYPSSISRAVQTLGGLEAIVKCRSSPSNKLELYLRPEDPYTHPVLGNLRVSNNLLLKISKRKPSASQEETENIQPCADIIARVSGAYHFEGMADYQHVVAIHAETARRKKREWSLMQESQHENAEGLDLDENDIMMVLPSVFSPKNKPEKIVLRSSNSSKRKQETSENHIEAFTDPALAIDFSITEIPKKVEWEQFTPKGSQAWHWQMALVEMFEEHPIWAKESLREKLCDKGFKFGPQTFKRLLIVAAYYFSTGPFRRFWIRRGYDPRFDNNSRMYQRMEFHVPLPLKSYKNNISERNQRWEELCQFKVFPFKRQVSLQLFELDDEFIQQIIQKPSRNKICTHTTGWFSEHVYESLRQCVMVRFLRVCPNPHAKHLLKAASDAFRRSRRACIREEELINQEASCVGSKSGNEVADGMGEMETDIEDSNESENGKDAEDALQSLLNVEDESRKYLQNLFSSFPLIDGHFDKLQDINNDGGGYHTYDREYDDSDEDEDFS